MAWTSNDDARFIDNVRAWPNWPRLPVKRHKGQGQLEYGVMFAILECRYTVFEGLMFDDAEKMIAEAPKHVYQSAAEIVADGWMVD